MLLAKNPLMPAILRDVCRCSVTEGGFGALQCNASLRAPKNGVVSFWLFAIGIWL